MFKKIKLAELLKTAYGLEASSIEKVASGYTNSTYLIYANSKKYVGRVSWSGKSHAQVEREEYLLKNIKITTDFKVPEIIPTLENIRHTLFASQENNHYFHLYNYIDGEQKYSWYELPGYAEFKMIIETLVSLHRAMAEVESRENHSLISHLEESSAFLNKEFFKMQALTDQLYLPIINNYTKFIKNAEIIIQHYKSIIGKTPNRQWIHKDIQLENILFEKQKVSAILDFDNIQNAPREFDIIYTLFNICRYGRAGELIEIDDKLFQEGFIIYRERARVEGVEVDWDLLDRKSWSFWKALYALDQSLMHLKALQNGIWDLMPGIGFNASFNEVIGYV